MESIYYVMTWLCHRACEHCYEDRFHPYHGDALREVVEQSRYNAPRVIENLPDRMTYKDLADSMREKRGRIILAGGEILLDPVREPVLYPALGRLHAKYRDRGGADLIVQTTGDVINGRIVAELLERHVSVISVSGLDEYHDGIDLSALQARLTKLFEEHGMKPRETGPVEGSPQYHFFGATPDQWIGKLWPRGRAHVNELSTATIADNFCNRWSGGLNFLQHEFSGSEVSIDPEGNVFPCCIKTKKPVGSLLKDPLESILDRLVGNPVYEAISMGHPERMGISHGWSVAKFLEESKVRLPSGRIYQNLCIGCDRFHAEVLMTEDRLTQLR